MTDTTDLFESFTDDYDAPAELIDDGDMGQLDYHCRRIRALERQRDDIDAVFRAETDRLAELWAERRRIVDNQIAWHSVPVESWHRAHPDRATVVLPNATLKLRHARTPKAWIADLDAVRAWAVVHHPEILRPPTVTDVRKVVEVVGNDGDYRAIDPATGEFVPGVSASLPEATWHIDTEPGAPL